MYYSISTTTYDRAKDTKLPFLFYEKEGSVEDLKNDVIKGFSFCQTFNSVGNFTKAQKTKSNLKAAYYIALDLDDMKIDYKVFVDKVKSSYKPSLVYTTASNGVDKHHTGQTNNNRYRVIYALDKPIFSPTMYSDLVKLMKNDISTLVGDDNVNNDTTDSDVAHFFAGNTNAEVWESDSVLSLGDLCERFDLSEVDNEKDKMGATVNIEKGKCNINENTQNVLFRKNKKENIYSELDGELVEDMKSLKMGELIEKYIRIYPIIENSGYELDPNSLYTLMPKDYKELRRRFELVEFKDGHTMAVPYKYSDGEGRKNVLFTRALIRHQIDPTAKFTQLFFNTVYELYYFIKQDKDDVITYKQIYDMIGDVLSDKYHARMKDVKFKINKSVAYAMGITPRQAAREVSKQLRYEEKMKKYELIASMYDVRLTNKENVARMNEAGLKVSLRYLKDYVKWEGVKKDTLVNIEKEKCNINENVQNDTLLKKTKKQQKDDCILALYDCNLTQKENLQILEDNDIHISIETLKRICKKYNLKRQK